MNKKLDTTSTAVMKHYVGQYIRYPDITEMRKKEGGRRVSAAGKQKTSQNPLVSIITVVFNASETLERTIQSVLTQTYDNIEYIIIDGGSNDGSLKIIESYEPVLEYFISEPDSGIYQAMNKGISLARGDYLCLLNADDYYLEEFISESVAVALKTKADIVYSDFSMFGQNKKSQMINDGIYIHYLNINHATFLTSQKAYNVIGPYREDYRIVSDAIWVRSAYKNKLTFAHFQKNMFCFTQGGFSSGKTNEERKLFIEEAGRSYRENFPFLTQEEAEELYLSRFGINQINTLKKLYYRYAEKELLFKRALREYLKFILKQNFVFKGNDITQYLFIYKELCNKLDVDYSNFNIISPGLDVKKIITQIKEISNEINEENNNKIRLMHFLATFSAPSETFIFDLIKRMQETERYSNVVLCDERILEDIRPYKRCIHLDWEKHSSVIREFIYEYVFKKIRPNAIITHFAINGWKLHQRLNPLEFSFPVVHMTHGIDVFSISTNSAYREYILKYASIDPRTAFTTVSEYLLNEMTSREIPKEKITFVPNVVHERFFKHRKYSNFYNGSRRLEVLNVGRLISLKGHNELLEGLDYFTRNVSKNIHLTILYGKSDFGLHEIKQKIDDLDLSEFVSSISFVDFNAQPDYYAKFDLFVSSSKYSEGAGKRSESFGMSTLEAIAAGLPVIVTDAGGSPEVVGDEKVFSKIVPHANGIAIGKAIESLVKDGRCFADNLEYAKERLTKFSAEQQLEQLGKAIDAVTAEKIQVGIFSSIIQGGAGKAATRVHKALMLNGLESVLITRDNNSVEPQEPNYEFLAPEIGLKWEKIQSRNYFRPGFTIFSLNEPGLKRETLKKLSKDMDIINIQWVARFLTAEDIGYLSNRGKPLVITVRDMHPLTGGCHFFHACERWQADCYGCPQLLGDKEHFPSKVLALKKRYWNMKNITFIALSQHTKNIIKQSSLYAGNRIDVIANPIDLKVFNPTAKQEARAHLKINDNKTPLLFYMPSYGSLVKGSYELIAALEHIKNKYPDFRLTIISAGSATALVKECDFVFPVISLGEFRDNRELAKVYSAADATIIPSLEETFSNTAAESLACGTPIVGFNTGAIPEFAGDGQRGESVPVGDVEALGEAVIRILSQTNLNFHCRQYAEENFSYKKQGEKYKGLLKDLIRLPKQDLIIDANDIPVIDPSLSTSNYYWQSEPYKKNNNQEFKQLLGKFCEVDFYKNPVQKIQKYMDLLKRWQNIKKNKAEQTLGIDDNIVKAFTELCLVDVKKKPIEKIKIYRKFIKTWQNKL